MGYRVKDEETGGARLALMIHPGSLLSRNPPQLNFTLTDISPPFAALLQQPPPRGDRAFFDETKTGIDPTLGNGETVRFSIDERKSRFVETFRRVSAYEMITSWPFSTTILSFDEWGDTWKKSILEEVNLEFGKLEFLDFFLHCIRVLDIDIGIISEVILFWICC